MHMMEEPLAAEMIWKLRLRHIWPKKEDVAMTASRPASALLIATGLSGYPTCSQQQQRTPISSLCQQAWRSAHASLKLAGAWCRVAYPEQRTQSRATLTAAVYRRQEVPRYCWTSRALSRRLHGK